MPNTRRSTPRRPTPCVPAKLMRLLRLSAPLVLLALLPIAVPGLLAESADQAQAQPPQQPPQQADANAPCSIAGMVAAGQARLPGVIVSVTPAGGGAALTTSTGLDGRYHVTLPGPGRYVVKTELAAFATVTKELAAEAPCQARLDVVMTLASRVPAPAPAAVPAAPPATAAVQTPAKPAAGVPAAAAPGTAGRWRTGRRHAASGFRSVPACRRHRHGHPTGTGRGTDRHDRRHAGAGRAAQPAARLHARDDVRHGDGVRPNRPDQRDAPVWPRRHGDVRRPRGHAWHGGPAGLGE